MKTKLLLLLLLLNFSIYAQTPNVPTYVPKDGLLSYFPFNGNATDVTGSGSTATPKDLTLTSDRFGISNSAYSFNGTSSNIEANIVDYPLKGGSRTLTGWFKATDIITSKESDFCLLSFGNTSDPNYWFKISFSKNGYLNIQLDAKTFQSPENYFNNQWTFYAMVFNDDTNTFSLYINNVLKLTGIADLYTNGSNTLFRIGKNKSNNYFEGTIDDIGIWNRMLTQEEITNLYNAKNQKPFYTLIPDINFENRLISLGIDSGIPDGEVLTENIKSIISLDISSNSITNLAGIQDFTLLTNLNVSGNQLKELDLTANKKLQILNCANSGNLTFVNIQNGNNNILTSVNFKNNPKLTCIQVDDVSYANTNWSNSKDAASNFSLNCNPTTSIPDRNFEKKLISLGIDSGIPDGKILTSKISSLTQLDVSYSFISDLTGIQDFTSLTSLSCIENQLTNLDISKNIALTSLDCNHNQLTNLDVSKNIVLTSLDCNHNQLTTLNTSTNTALTNLVCHSNKLRNLDITNNVALKSLNCNSNLLIDLKTSKNIALTNLICYYNNLTNLDVSSNIALTNFDCNSNQIISLDVSKNTVLKFFNFSANKLTSLNLKNGNNTNFNNTNYTVDNPQLTCIQVDDVAYSNANWSNYKDATASFSTSCNALVYTLIPDVNFENKLIALNIDSGVPDGKVLTSAISGVTTLDLDNSSISDLTGIGDFTALTILYCSANNLTTIDVSKNKALESLTVSRNKLSSLDLTSNTNLMSIECGTNQLRELNTTKNPELTTISCATNKLTSINVSQNPALINLTVADNKITTLDLSNNPVLNVLFCSNNLLQDLNVTKNPRLLALQCQNNQIINLDISKNIMLSNFKCNDNNLSFLSLKNGVNTKLNVIELKNNPNLTCIEVDDVAYSNTNWSGKKDATATFNINCSQEYTLIPDANFEERLIMLGIDKDGKNGKVLNTSISKIDHLYVGKYSIKDLTGISGFTSLRGLRVSENELTSLDLSKNTLLDTLDCSKNKLRTLNLKNGNNKNFYSNRSNFSDNPDLTCIQVDDVAYSNANWATIKDASATFDTNCPIEYVTLPDSNFEQKLIDLGIDTDGLNGKITITDVSFITSLDLSNTNIKDLTGIENFTSLTALDFSNNQITNIDLSKNILLETLNASSNQITTLDLSKNVNLRIVYIVNNPLISLNLRNGNNKNFVLPVETGKKSVSLYTSFLGLTNLGCIQVDDADYSNANWSKIKEANTTYSNTCKSLGIEDNTFDKVAIYPNPTKGEVNISNIKVEKATVYNSLGQLVRTFILDSSNSNNTINLSGLPKGVYYIYLINQDAASAKKIIVE